MRFRLASKSMTLDDLELLYVHVFSEFCTWRCDCEECKREVMI